MSRRKATFRKRCSSCGKLRKFTLDNPMRNGWSVERSLRSLRWICKVCVASRALVFEAFAEASP